VKDARIDQPSDLREYRMEFDIGRIELLLLVAALAFRFL
jgi:hypothetical protein